MDTDEVLDSLDDLLTALDEVEEQLRGMRSRAERIRRGRRRDLGYREIIETEEEPLIVEALTRAVQRLQASGSRFRREQARALHREGMTMDRIAEHYGVARQRVSAILRSAESGDR